MQRTRSSGVADIENKFGVCESERRSATYHRAEVARARRLQADATTRWLKEHLQNEITRHEQIAAEIERVSEPEADAASPRHPAAAVSSETPADDPGVRLDPFWDDRALRSERGRLL
jgi:hypothetical protein